MGTYCRNESANTHRTNCKCFIFFYYVFNSQHDDVRLNETRIIFALDFVSNTAFGRLLAVLGEYDKILYYCSVCRATIT